MKRFLKITVVAVALFAISTLVLTALGVNLGGLATLLGGTGAGIAHASVVGASATPKGTLTEGPTNEDDLDKNDILTRYFEKIVLQMSSSRFSLETMTRKNKNHNQKTQSQVIKYFSRESTKLSDSIDSTATGDGSTSSLPASSFTYSATGDGTPFLWLKPTNAKLWKTNDTVLIRDCKVMKTGEELVQGGATELSYDQMFSVSEKANDAIKIVPIGGMRGKNKYSGTSDYPIYVMPGFTATAMLYRLGSAFDDLSINAETSDTIPEMEEQYTQRFFAQIEMTKYAQMEKKNISYGMEEMDREAMLSFRAEQEATFWFGTKHKTNMGKNGGMTYFTQGITRMIDQELTYGKGSLDTSISSTQYMEWMEVLFTGNSGSGERVLFAGSSIIKSLGTLRETTKNISGSSNTIQSTYLGVKCTELVSDFGQIHVIHTPIFDELGWKDHGVFLDMEQIYRYTFDSFKSSAKDMEALNVHKTNAKVFEENCALIARYSDCHAILAPAA